MTDFLFLICGETFRDFSVVVRRLSIAVINSRIMAESVCLLIGPHVEATYRQTRTTELHADNSDAMQNSTCQYINK